MIRAGRYVPSMASPPKKPARARIFLKEWMQEKGVSDIKMGEALGITRQSVFRYHEEQHRLRPQKLAKIAEVLGVTTEELFRPPGRKSIDAVLAEASDADHDFILGTAERLMARGQK